MLSLADINNTDLCMALPLFFLHILMLFSNPYVMACDKEYLEPTQAT